MKKYIKVKQLENKNQFIVINDDYIYFQSYDSLIAVYDKEKKRIVFG